MADVTEPQDKRASTPKSYRPTKKPATEKRAALNMRIQPDLRNLIDQAAAATGKNRTNFVLDATRQAAQTALLDQVHVRLQPEAFAAFLKRFDAPSQPNEHLRKSLQTAAPWE